jgi:hypothetical protein
MFCKASSVVKVWGYDLNRTRCDVRGRLIISVVKMSIKSCTNKLDKEYTRGTAKQTRNGDGSYLCERFAGWGVPHGLT